MPKCDFNSIAKQLSYNHTSVWVFYNFTANFQNTFLEEHLWKTTSAYFEVFFRYGRRFLGDFRNIQDNDEETWVIWGIYIKV